MHEEVLRGTAAEVREILTARESVKGEIVLVIGPLQDEAVVIDDTEVEAAITLALQDNSASKAATLVAKQFNLKKDDIYGRILKRK